jgi:hypothetical protein
MTSIRQTQPGQFYQGVDEEKSYTINVGNWFTAPTGASTVVKEGTVDRSASVLRSSGSLTSISGSLVTTPCMVNLTAGTDYRVEVKLEESGEILECFFFVTGET